MGNATKKIAVILCALALILPMGIIGLGQLSGNGGQDQVVADSAQDIRPLVDPQSQPQPTNTTAPELSAYPDLGDAGEAGVLETSRYLFDSYAYMLATGDTAPWESVTSADCSECASFAANAGALGAAGGWIVGGEITLDSQQVTMNEDGTAVLDANFTEAPATLVDDPTREAVSREGSNGAFQLGLKQEAGAWKVTSIVLK